MAKSAKGGGIRRAFLRGLFAVLPTLLTILILWKAIEFLYGLIAAPIGRGVNELMRNAGLIPTQWPEGQWWVPFWKAVPSIVGLSAAILIVYFIGFFVASVIGRRIGRQLEQLWMKLPAVRQVYPYVRQFTSALLARSEGDQRFVRAVAVEYPRRGVYSMGLVVSEGMKDLVDAAGRPLTAVFIPSSPTPFTGYVVTFPSDEIIALRMTVDQAMRFAVSAGVIVPPEQLAAFSARPPEETPKADDRTS